MALRKVKNKEAGERVKKNRQQRGFTLLEVVAALVLFTLLMSSLWDFFAGFYKNYTVFDEKADLLDQGKIVAAFIKEEIRLADEVKIVLKDGAVISPVDKPHEAINGVLDKIELRTTFSTSGKKKRAISFKSGKLTYDNLTSSLISDKIESIEVTKEPDSFLVKFECLFLKKGETSELQKVTYTFIGSLEHKALYEE